MFEKLSNENLSEAFCKNEMKKEQNLIIAEVQFPKICKMDNVLYGVSYIFIFKKLLLRFVLFSDGYKIHFSKHSIFYLTHFTNVLNWP